MAIQARIPFDSIPLLATLKGEDRAAVEPLCRMRGYEKGEVIFREGEAADRIHFIYAGRVKIVKSAGSRDIIIELLGPGEPVGAVAAFERKSFPATAIAIEPAGIVSIPEREFFQLLENRPEMTRSLLGGLTMRLMMVNKRLADMTGSVETRAARLFLTLAERLGNPRDEGVFIPLTLSRQELADLLGTTLETAIRLMSRWHKEELVHTEKAGFAIPHIDALREVSQTL
ncbi:MAG TPA: Crp/Fnr family transcriptional regulator [Thermoanaerobaculia bacterium]|nr:Crp/Fnr family transcriptional regulator [Thermoanaerobaculia bacterium]